MTTQITESYNKIISSIPDGVTLVAVSKTKPSESINELYKEGQRIFGENRVEELVEKHNQLPKDIKWHMIGHLQSKKVKKIAGFIDLVHSVDSFKLLIEINKQAKVKGRTIYCLLQFHIAQESSKYGLTLKEGIELINSDQFNALQNIKIVGVMGMATFTSDKNIVQSEFESLKNISNEVIKSLPDAKQISMGMSNDFQQAIDAGSTMIRVGSTIFGRRN